jgi:arabinoxylan arabinofuranohydrolase
LNSGCIAIGVAVAQSPSGPFTDGIGKALITSKMTTDKTHSRDDLDPTMFIDDDG